MMQIDRNESLTRGIEISAKTAMLVNVEPVTAELRKTISEAWQSRRDDPLRTRLALEAGLAEAYRHLAAGLKATVPAALLTERLAILADYGQEESVPAVLLSASSLTRPDKAFSTASKAASHFSSVCFSIPILPPVRYNHAHLITGSPLLRAGPGKVGGYSPNS
jgi:hypothetical protein